MDKSQLSSFSRLLESVYAALWSPGGMDSALMALKKYFGCCSATLVAMRNSPRQINYGWSVGIPEIYGRKYMEENMVARDIAIDYFSLESPKQNSFVSSSQLLQDTPLVDVVTDEFKPWISGESIVDTSGYILSQDSDETLLISFQRNQERGQFTQDELQQMNLIVPHVKQCVGLFNNFHQQQIKSDTLQSAMNSLQLPTFVLNNLLQLVHANTAADEFLKKHDAISILNKQLLLQDSDLHHEYIFHACKLVSYRVDNANCKDSAYASLDIPYAKGEIKLNLSPMFSLQEGSGHKQGLLVQCYEVEQAAELSAALIQKALSLTKAEAEVCFLLANGLSVADIAKQRGVSINTVREQVRSVYKKTPYSRQGELITAILAL